MKNIFGYLIGATILFSNVGFAAGTQYDMRVDGLACPFCAYGIEKKFTQTEGVDSVEINLQKGLVIVKTSDGKTFQEQALKQIIHDVGFTMKSVTQRPLP